MSKVLKRDRSVIATLEQPGNLVEKVVLRGKFSGFQRFNPEQLVEREIRTLGMIQDLEGVQRFVRKEGSKTLYTGYIPCISLKRFKGRLPKSYFDELTEITHECFRRGIYRVQQGRADFLISPDLRPIIIDFGGVMFYDDPIARIPGIITLAKACISLRVWDLKRRYT